MKNLWILVALVCFSISLLDAQNKPIRKFYRKFKKKENVSNIALPGIVVRTGVGIASWFVKEEEEKQALKLAKKVKGIRVLSDESGRFITRSDMKNLAMELQAQRKSFEPLMIVREKGSLVYLLGRIKRNKIKQLVILTHEEGEATMVSVKSRLKMKHLNKFMESMKDDYDLPEEVVPKKQKKRPQA